MLGLSDFGFFHIHCVPHSSVSLGIIFCSANLNLQPSTNSNGVLVGFQSDFAEDPVSTVACGLGSVHLIAFGPNVTVSIKTTSIEFWEEV